MNWYKEANTSKSVTVAEFLAMNLSEKMYLAKNTSITPDVQKLFFTQEYDDKYMALPFLALNTSITPDVQKLFFTQEYETHSLTLRRLAENTSITPEVQKLFFTQEYRNKGWLLPYIVDDTSFLKICTPEQFYILARLARGTVRLYVYKKRLEQLQGAQ